MPRRPKKPTRKMTAGKKASRELYAICCARPMASSARNCLKVRLKTSSHSPSRNAVGERGGRPTPRRRSAAVDKAETAEPDALVPLAALPREQSHRGPDPAGEHEPGGQGPDSHDRQPLADPRSHVGGLAETRAERDDRVRELLALDLD